MMRGMKKVYTEDEIERLEDAQKAIAEIDAMLGQVIRSAAIHAPHLLDHYSLLGV